MQKPYFLIYVAPATMIDLEEAICQCEIEPYGMKDTDQDYCKYEAPSSVFGNFVGSYYGISWMVEVRETALYPVYSCFKHYLLTKIRKRITWLTLLTLESGKENTQIGTSTMVKSKIRRGEGRR